MEAHKQKYTRIVNGNNQYVIPVFQRDYNWTEEQCAQLWEDLLRVSDTESNVHFFGPLVYIDTKDVSAAFSRWLLVDGQQRMTSVSLLIAAIRDHIKDESISESTPPEKIEHDFLLNPYEKEENKRKLVLRDRDDATLYWLLANGPEPNETEKSYNVEQNYLFFRTQISESQVDPDRIINAVDCLTVVDVRLERGKDDPQQIFETLNSTGLDLTQADLVRNYILMGLDEENQTNLYRKYWKKLELLYGRNEYKLDSFFRDFVSLERKIQKQPRVDQVYSLFRTEFPEIINDVTALELFLAKIVRFGKFHASFTIGTNHFPELTNQLERIHQLSETPATLIMRLLECYEDDTVSQDEMIRSLSYVESYLVRRFVCGLQTRSYWAQFSRLAYAIEPDDVVDTLTGNFYRLNETKYSFPKDAEFRSSLENEDLYGRDICRNLLVQLERGDSREHTDTTNYTIEHVMPQNEDLREEWRTMLGKNWEELHKSWLHRLGNLTLSAYNQEYSDRSFEEKKSIANGFDQSPLYLNRYISDQQIWTEHEIAQRSRILADRALSIWRPLGVTSEAIRKVEFQSLTNRGVSTDHIKTIMDEQARQIFDSLHNTLLSIDSNLLDVAIQKSVGFYSQKLEFICEAILRARRIILTIDIDSTECVDCDLEIIDFSSVKRLTHAQYEALSIIYLYSTEDVRKCKPVLEQAISLSLD